MVAGAYLRLDQRPNRAVGRRGAEGIGRDDRQGERDEHEDQPHGLRRVPVRVSNGDGEEAEQGRHGHRAERCRPFARPARGQAPR